MCEACESPFASRDMDRKALELGLGFAPKFDSQGLITAVAVDHETGDVLMIAYMNDQALLETIRHGRAVYFSRSRQRLWRKGEESGNVQVVKDILVDCDQDALVLKVEQIGGAACHNGYRSCFYRRVKPADQQAPNQPLALEQADADRVFDPAEVYKPKPEAKPE